MVAASLRSIPPSFRVSSRRFDVVTRCFNASGYRKIPDVRGRSMAATAAFRGGGVPASRLRYLVVKERSAREVMS